jgi:hypothetical protein
MRDSEKANSKELQSRRHERVDVLCAKLAGK